MKEDWVRIIETAYDLVDDAEKWLTAVGEAVRPALDRGFGVVGYFFDASTWTSRAPACLEMVITRSSESRGVMGTAAVPSTAPASSRSAISCTVTVTSGSPCSICQKVGIMPR